MSANTTYYYRLRAYNGSGTSGNSGTISVTTLSAGPPAPVTTAATGMTSSGFTAHWNSSIGATGYRLDVSTSSTFASYVPGIQDLDIGNYIADNISGLSANTTYYYRLRAYNGSGASGNSGTISVTTLPTPLVDYTVAVSASPSNGGAASGSGTFPEGNIRTVAAMPNSGYAFANWAENGVVVTNSGHYTFVLTTNRNLVANFVDAQKPSLMITAPTAGQRWSNAVFTVQGKAADNQGVAGVWCQTNGVWGSVSTANGWTNWNVDVALVPGPNTVRAYSQDTAGNLSPTQNVSFVYVLSGQMVVQTNGNGTVSPNYNGRMLEIGQSYTMTAIPGRGFGLANWTAGQGGAVVTNKATVRFVMQSNLVLVANFVDITRPVVSLVSPGQRISNTVAQVSIQGRASDNVGVTGVQYQLNGGVWAPTDTSNGWTNWTATLAPAAGTNVVKACAVDAAGNRSLTNWVSFFYVVPSPLTLLTNGVGTITRNFTGNVLEVGRSYTVTAVHGTGQVFSNWVGGVTSSSAALSFLMQSNLVLQANFVPNPYIAFQGSYNGLFYPMAGSYMTTNATGTNTGFIKLSLLSDQGGFSGSLQLGGATLPFSGQFNVQLQSQVSVARWGKTPLALSLQLHAAIYDAVMDETWTNVLTGSVTNGDQWVSALCAYRAATGSSNAYAGLYTLLIEGCNDWGACFGDGDKTLPDGDSPAAVKITPAGAITMMGTLADGANISQITAASEQGYWPLYVPLYGGRGFLAGWMVLATDQTSYPLRWQMPPSVAGHFNTNGFGQDRQGFLTPYLVPPPGQNAVPWTNGIVVMTGGDLPQPADPAQDLQSQVVLSNNLVQVTGGSISNLNLRITVADGLFTGSFVNPVTQRVTSFHGALVADPDSDSGGWWLGSQGQGGNIRLEKQ